MPAIAGRWLQTVDPGAHRRVKGLRLVTVYTLAALLGAQTHAIQGLSGASLSALAAGFALWASVSEAQATRAKSTIDLVLFCAAAALGAASVTLLAPLLRFDRAGLELVLLTGAFLVGYLRRFGLTGTGLGSQIYIGQLLAYGAADRPPDLQTIALAGAIAALASVVPRVLSGPAEHPPSAPARLASPAGALGPYAVMGLQAATAGFVIVAVNAWLGLNESVWAITACTYVVAASRAATVERVRRRILGTFIGVPIGLAFLPVTTMAPLLVWPAAALAMVVYAMALPDRYDIACGAFAFALIVTLAVGGEHSVPLLAARAWETLLGAGLGWATASLLRPLRSPD